MSTSQHVARDRRRVRSRRWRAAAWIVALTLTALPTVGRAQHGHQPVARPDSTRRDSVAAMPGMPGMPAGGHDMQAMMEGPLGISHVRMGSATVTTL